MILVPAILAAALAFSPTDARLALDTAGELVSTAPRRDSGTRGAETAAAFIALRVSQIGADVKRDRFKAKTPAGLATFSNLHADFVADPAAPWVVIVSHYDTKPGADCPGANDGASTTGLLVALAAALRRERPARGNVRLMWLDGEECRKAYLEDDGFQGSKRAARLLAESGLDVKAVVCVDMLGDRDLEITIPRNSSPKLKSLALDAARRAGLGYKVRAIDELVKDDHVAFLSRGFPAIDLIDFDYGSEWGLNDYWHSPRDTVDKLSARSLYDSGRLVAGMVNALFGEAEK